MSIIIELGDTLEYTGDRVHPFKESALIALSDIMRTYGPIENTDPEFEFVGLSLKIRIVPDNLKKQKSL